MKKCLTVVIIVLMVLSFAACYANNEAKTDVDTPLLSEGATSSTASEVTTTTLAETPTSTASTEAPTTTEPTMAVTTTKAVTAAIPTTTAAVAAITTTAQSKPSVPTSVKTTTTKAATTRVTTTRKAVTTTAKPTTTAAPFDIGYWVQYSKDYAVSVGLKLDNTATACWDNPITASPTSKYLERDIKSRLDWYKRSGFTVIWAWSEKRSDGKFNLYIGYG